ncbi:MAG: hypothetical protein Q9164_006378 [Protoblastenia rupestris]
MHFTRALLPIIGTLISFVSAIPTPASNGHSALVKRYELEDATNVALIKEWLGENVDNDNFVFYSGSTVGQPMAKAFCDENSEDGYKYFYYIFDDAFSLAFGGADPSAATDIARACSQAMAEYAEGEVRVFNNAGAAVDSFWVTIERPGLLANENVDDILLMRDGATDPDQNDGDLKDS